ncbi:amino acid permease [Streptomyces sp. NPDC059874]|uniref:amino acid permease n=1 Tax=Streptomyces sp. NPDC059874 TaxID=3346983 RepID=UPI00365CC9CF
MVLVKPGVLVLFIVVGITGFDSGNLQPFAPMGMAGISTAAATVVFAFIGLDAVSTAGAVLSLVSVTLVVLYGQSRILYTMGRDGMLPPAFRRVSPRTGTPAVATLLTGGFVALLAAAFPLDLLADLTSMGTLAASPSSRSADDPAPHRTAPPRTSTAASGSPAAP